jgi:hypothetical protein
LPCGRADGGRTHGLCLGVLTEVNLAQTPAGTMSTVTFALSSTGELRRRACAGNPGHAPAEAFAPFAGYTCPASWSLYGGPTQTAAPRTATPTTVAPTPRAPTPRPTVAPTSRAPTEEPTNTATPTAKPMASPTPLPTRSPSPAPSPAPTFIPTFGALAGLKVSVNGIAVEVQPTSQSWDGRRVTFQCLKRTRSQPLNPTGALLILSRCVLLPANHVTMRLMQRGRAQTRGTSGTATTVTWPHAAAPRVGTGARTHSPMPGRCGSASRASHAPSARGATFLSLRMHRNAPNALEISRQRNNAALPSQTTAVMQLCSSNP